MKRYFKKKTLFGAVVLFVLLNVGSYIIHAVLLGADYQALDKVMRADMMSKMWIFQIVYLFQAYFLSYFFSGGYEGGGWQEGARYGIAMGLFMKIPEAYGQYVVYPLPYELSMKTFLFGFIEIVILGVVLGYIHQKKK